MNSLSQQLASDFIISAGGDFVIGLSTKSVNIVYGGETLGSKD